MGLFGLLFDVELIGSDGATVGVVDQVERDIRDTLPSVFWGNAPLGEQDVQRYCAKPIFSGSPPPSIF